ncbi:maleylpyruvate isomerase family mycothiol-dependent enzyme [Kitasatospora camelliae]|uniref:Maleylpyruvate isomerase family mycothiol-dependent enzyme n=1 Tax=Kitasatospora camelliae TaxID=3156397 RepID=A0AAU8JP50_9ACTN
MTVPQPDAPYAALLAELEHSSSRVAVTLDGLDEAGLRAASGLPGWSRAQVVAHLAHSADAYRRLLGLARGERGTGARPSAEEMARAVERTAAQPAAVLAADLRERLAVLFADARAMPAAAWDATVTALAGWPHPAWYTLYRCWRELETHHVDLARGYAPADWPAAYVAWALDDTLAALGARRFPLGRVRATDLDRSWPGAASGPDLAAPGHALLAWLSGRAAAPPGFPAPLQVPPAWPLPLPGHRP